MTIEWQNITKVLGGNTLLSKVFATAPSGAITHLAGANGSGKTSLLHIATGLLLPDEGVCLVDGVCAAERRNVAQRIGVVFDEGGLNRHWSVWMHLRAFSRLHGCSREYADEILVQHGLNEKAALRPPQLSLGYRRRLALAIAMIGKPRHLLLDEPFNGLDAESVDWLAEYLLAYKTTGGAVVFAAHESRVSEALADYVIHLSNGMVVAPSDEVSNQ